MKAMTKMSSRVHVIGKDTRNRETGNAGRATMKFKRLLMAGLMALCCAATATASQLDSVQVTPKANTATVNLRTTGSFAHKEYRPEENVLTIDLTGVTSAPAVERTLQLDSAVLKGYKLTSYTSASGAEVTRIEFTLGDQVTADVNDMSSGLQILMTGGVNTTLFPSLVHPAQQIARQSAAAPAPQTPAPVQMASASPQPPAPAPSYAVPVVPEHDSAQALVKPEPQAELSAPSASTPIESKAQLPSEAPSAATPVTIRGVSVRTGKGSLDIVVEGPNSAHSFLLKNPDRLVLDFSNAVARPSVRNIAVHTKDVAQVRIGRLQTQPPGTRVVVDLKGPHTFDVLPSDKQLMVRIKTGDESVPTPLDSAPSPIQAASPAVATPARTALKPAAAVVSAPVVASVSESSTPQSSSATNAALASTPLLKNAAMQAVSGPSPVPAQPSHDPDVRAGMAADTLASSSQASKPANSQPAEVVPGSTASVSPAPAAPKYTGEPISVNLKDVDLKDFFRLIHEISGLNIVLDPNVHGNVTLVLDDVPWDQALDIVLKNNGLDRELQGRVLRIAATDTLRKEAIDRRAQSEAIALAVDRQTITRFLSYAKSKDVAVTVKKFLTARGDVISDERTNALIISDIPSVLPNLDRLISQLDKKSQEVEIEVRVVSATRSFSRDLGFQLGLNWANGASSLTGLNALTSLTTTSSTTGTNTTTNTNPVSIPLFSNMPATSPTTGLVFTNVAGFDAVLTAAESHNLAKVLSRPRIVTQSNVKAEVKQGVKLPIYTAGTGNSNASVSYIDSVLRLSVTPQVTADNTVFLTVDVENTQPEGQANSTGNFILSTQQATTQVLVTDGATVVIGGVIQTNNTVSSTQTPFLGSIPWLGNLFKERYVSTETDELIFFITPKIIQT
jgi:type IV pilus secretin PilQ/predicted competence protein